MYIKENLNYKRENKHDKINESIITIKVGYPRKKKIMIIAYYRQWSLLGIENSNRIFNQNRRFDSQTKEWEKILQENPDKEVIICGDMNINYRIINKEENLLSTYEKSLKPMAKMIEERLIGNGMTMLVNKNTRKESI